MTPRLRKLTLTAHVASSVGWLGAVAAFLALSLIGLTSDDAETARSAYVVMEPAAWLILVPLAFAALVTGIVQALSTQWGLVRHYWVVFKLLITIVATLILLMYTETLSSIADAAAESPDLADVRNPSPALHAGGALVLLLVATALAVYKPSGRTPYGWRKHDEAVARRT
jgi:hypothetical protein